MIRRLFLALLVLAASLSVNLDTAEAARRGLFGRVRNSRTMSYRANNSRARRSSSTSTSASSAQQPKLYTTHSRSAILDGINSGGQGYDRSWYVGR